MQVVFTRFIGPTSHRSARIRVTPSGGHTTRIYSWKNNLDVNENHRAAAEKFLREVEWMGRWIGGDTQHGHVYVHVPGSSYKKLIVKSP